VYVRTWGILVESVSTCPSTCTGSTKVTVTPQCSDDVLYTTQCHMYVYVHITLCDYTRTSTALVVCYVLVLSREKDDRRSRTVMNAWPRDICLFSPVQQEYL